MSLRKVGTAGESENLLNAEVHLERKQKKYDEEEVRMLIRKTDCSPQ